jgi:hypothetical protein
MSLQIGDVCIVVSTAPNNTHLIGMECTIVDVINRPLAPYLTDVPTGDGRFFYACDRNLRKKQPPDDRKKRETDKPELGSWDVCPFGTDQKPWRPRRVTA